MNLLTAGHQFNSKDKIIYICIKIRLQAGFEPSTLSVKKKSFLHTTYFTTAALPRLMANSSYYNVYPINC